jgi:hypothetical protein
MDTMALAPHTASTLTYPISPDYVKEGKNGTGWNVQRALAEFIANALDEDPRATVTYTNGTLTITDNGPGIPEEGLLLGYSPKGDEQIGQFGEGSKIGALVLARSPEVGDVYIETVGYAIVPTIERRRVLHGIAPRRNAEAPEVLVYTFHPSSRTQGTKVTVKVAAKDAKAAMARFRHLSEVNYTAPSTAQVILDGTPGRLYIGGVYVSTIPKMLASYDFPLAAAKSAQNRDRTVVSSETVQQLVCEALAATSDITVISKFVNHCLDGGKLADAEKYFRWVTDPHVKAAFRTVSRDLFQGEKVFFSAPGDEEASLDLADKQVRMIQTKLDYGTNYGLMSLLGIQQAQAARKTIAVESRKGTKYIAESKLTQAERLVLERTQEQVRAVFGSDAFDIVRVYSETSRYLECTLGFYEPNNGSISLSRQILSEPLGALETLLHECAHRLAHRRGTEYNDRSRGFEHQLGTMLALAVARLTDGESATDGAPASDAEITAQSVAAGVSEDVPAERIVLTEVLNERLGTAKVKYGVKSGPSLMGAIGRHTGNWKLLTSAHAAGWRNRSSSQSPSLITDYRAMQVIGDALDISAPALWLAHVACEAAGYSKTGGSTAGPWRKRVAEAAVLLSDDLDASGQGGLAEQIRELAAGRGDQSALRGIALELITAERDRSALVSVA